MYDRNYYRWFSYKRNKKYEFDFFFFYILLHTPRVFASRQYIATADYIKTRLTWTTGILHPVILLYYIIIVVYKQYLFLIGMFKSL